MIFGLLYFCVVILCVNRSRSSFILYRIVKRHSRQANVRRIWTCADNEILSKNQILTSIKGRNSVAILRKTKIYNNNADLVNDNVNTKFGLNLFILKILSKNQILTSIKGRNSVANCQKQ